VAVDQPGAAIVVDAELVAALVRDQHPAFAGAVRLAARGWDNAMFRVGDRHVVRVPRDAETAAQVEKEIRWMPDIAARLPVPSPVPLAVGRPSARLPWVWSILRWHAGTLADAVDASARTAFAEQLADAVAALHSPAPADAPADTFRGRPLAGFDAEAEHWFGTTPLEAAEADALRAIWRAGVASPAWSGPPLWLHNDLHPANLLVDPATGMLTAVIDFGDLGVGDPAGDLAAAWMTFDPEGRRRFRARLTELAGYDADAWRRGHAIAAVMAAITLHSPRPETVAMGRTMVAQTLVD
jgi:aminoglycoside phosphotransferase (APT) family kinase protein